MQGEMVSEMIENLFKLNILWITTVEYGSIKNTKKGFNKIKSRQKHAE